MHFILLNYRVSVYIYFGRGVMWISKSSKFPPCQIHYCLISVFTTYLRRGRYTDFSHSDLICCRVS